MGTYKKRHRIMDFCASFLLIGCLCTTSAVVGQISRKATLPSVRFGITVSPDVYQARGINAEFIRLEDLQNDENGRAFRYAVILPLDLSFPGSGKWTPVPGSGRIWCLTVATDGALAVAPYFDDFHLPPGGELFIYNKPSGQILGAYSSDNNTELNNFSSELIEGPLLTIEYYEPEGAETARFHLSGIAFAYRGTGGMFRQEGRGFGDAGECEVNCSCTEGSNWRDEKNSVVRIAVRNGSAAFWCTGSLVNNTRSDFEPYILTADHCAYNEGEYASASDLNQWIFYMNYESPTCDDPLSEPGYRTLAGATLVSQGGYTGNTGSDFYLVLLNNQVPPSYNPYFSGWNRLNVAASSGVTIHHPQGDVKKISTFTQPLVSAQWSNNGLQSHWQVKWSATDNGHGVTEGGSSGSPLFDEDGLIVGTLTGGESSCSNLDGRDYYGKFSYHWMSNGEPPSSRLADWLDPDQTGLESLQGTYYINIALADFMSDTTAVPVNGSLNFTDLSSGRPTGWKWEFEGGEPRRSDEQNPRGIRYASYGQYDVQLIITNEIGSDTLIRKDYIHVEPVISPNPSSSVFNVFLGNINTEEIESQVVNAQGVRVPFTMLRLGSDAIRIDLHGNTGSLYFLRLESPEHSSSSKLILIH